MPCTSKEVRFGAPTQWEGHHPSLCPSTCDPLLRPPPSLREASYRPSGSVSFRAIRGYRPRDYFVRGVSLGGDTKVGGVASASASTHAADGYAAWRPKACADIPQITACSRFWSSMEKTKEVHERVASSSSDEEEHAPVVMKCPDPPKCICTAEVETKTFTSDAFTMTEKRSRDQGTMVDLQTAEKAVDATLVMRDVTTDTDDPFPEEETKSSGKSTGRESFHFDSRYMSYSKRESQYGNDPSSLSGPRIRQGSRY